MFDFLRGIFRSTAGRQQEQLNAYLDNALLPEERRRFEQHLDNNPELRSTLASLRLLKSNLRQLPRQRAPRSFALSSAVHGRRRLQPAAQLYPVMRVATVMTAFFLVLAVVMNLLTTDDAMTAMVADSAAEMESVAVMDVTAQVESRLFETTDVAGEVGEADVAVMVIDEDMAVESFLAESPDPAEADRKSTPDPTKTAAAPLPAARATESQDGQTQDQPHGGVAPESTPPIVSEIATEPSPAPTATTYTALVVEPTTAVAVTSSPLVTVPAPPNPWPTIQVILGGLFITLLVVTLFLRRRVL